MADAKPAISFCIKTVLGNSMNLAIEAIQFFSAVGLALFVGALLTEAVVLVPMWRSLPSQDFFLLHAAHAHRLYGFFAPLTATATCLSVVAAVTSATTGHSGSLLAVVAATLTLLIVSTFFLYFRRANASFEAASIKPEDLPAELARWAFWHWFRTVIGLGALSSTLLSLRGIA